MDAVLAKSSRKKPLFRKKGAPSIVIAVGGPPPKPEMDAPDDEEAPKETLTCPKCGAELADTPENAEYVASKREDDDDDAAEEDY
jgi:hypothetical protein